jgi:hypothetical protein
MNRPTLDFFWDVISGIDIAQFPAVQEYRDLLPEENEQPFIRILQLATRYLFKFISHCDDTHQLKAKAEKLAALYAHHIPAAKGFLDSLSVAPTADGNPLVREVVLTAPDDDIRIPFAQLLSSIARTLAHHEYGFFFEQPTTVKFIDSILALLAASSDRHPSRLSPLIYILHQFAQTSVRERLVLLQRNVIFDLVALYDKSRGNISGSWSPKAPLLYLFELLADLVTACENPSATEPLEHAELAASLDISLKLHPEYHAKLHEKQFLISVCRESLYLGPMRRIWAHFLPFDPHLYLSVVSMASNGADTTHDAQHRRLYLDVLKDILGMADSEDLHAARSNHIMNEAIRLLTSNLRIESYRTQFLLFVFEIDAQFPRAHTWLVEHDDYHQLFKTNNDVRKWTELYQSEAYLLLFTEREEFLKSQAPSPVNAASADPDPQGAFHDSDEGEDEHSPASSIDVAIDA